jgi:hypothetical protein
MAHRFVVVIDNVLHTFDNFLDIPENIDFVVEFIPEIPPEPHTEEQHQEIEAWGDKFQDLLEREYASSSKTR